MNSKCLQLQRNSMNLILIFDIHFYNIINISMGCGKSMEDRRYIQSQKQLNGSNNINQGALKGSYIFRDEGIIYKGNDRRFKTQEQLLCQFPYNCIGLLEVVSREGKAAFGTGFLIQSDLVLTSAHLFYYRDPQTNQMIDFKPLHFFPRPSNYPKNSYDIIKQRFPKQYKQIMDKIVQMDSLSENLTNLFHESIIYDYSIFKINPPIILKQYISINPNFNNNKAKISIFGYPNDHVDILQFKEKNFKLYGHEDFGIQQIKNGILFHQLDTVGGQSGSPVLENSNETVTAIAIHKGSAGVQKNCAKAFDFKTVKIIKEWCKQIKGSSSINIINIEKDNQKGKRYPQQYFPQSYLQKQKLLRPSKKLNWQLTWDNSTPHAKKFKINGRLIKRINGDIWSQLVASYPLPQGLTSFKMKVKTYGRNDSEICIGLISSKRKMKDWSGKHFNSAAYWTTQSYVAMKGFVNLNGKQQIEPTDSLFIAQNQFILMRINTNTLEISWESSTEQKQRVFKLQQNFKRDQLFVFVQMYKNEDSVIFQLIK